MNSASTSSPPPFRQKIGHGTIGWGLVGASQVAARHMIAAIRDQSPAPGPDAETTGAWVVGVFSHDEQRAKRFAEIHQIPHAFVNLSDLLAHSGIRCVYVSSHPRHHAQVVIAALAAGKHVLCEPPLALSLADAHAIEQMAVERGLFLGVNFVRRADPAIIRLRELLGENAIGDLVGGRVCISSLLDTRLQTWRLQPNGGGVVTDRSAPGIDLLRYLLRDEVDSVLATETRRILGRQVEEDVLAQVHMKRANLTIQVHASFIVPHVTTCVELYGSSGFLAARDCFVDDVESTLVLKRHAVSVDIPIRRDPPFRRMVRNFLDAIRDGVPLLATGRDAIASLATQEAIRESMPYARTVKLESPSRSAYSM